MPSVSKNGANAAKVQPAIDPVDTNTVDETNQVVDDGSGGNFDTTQAAPTPNPKPAQTQSGFDDNDVHSTTGTKPTDPATDASTASSKPTEQDKPDPVIPWTTEDFIDKAPRSYKEQVLADAGFDKNDLKNMTNDEIYYAFESVVNAAQKPGTTKVSLTYTTVEPTGTSEGGDTMNVPHYVNQEVKITKAGEVGGHKLDVEGAQAAYTSASLLSNQVLLETAHELVGPETGKLSDEQLIDLYAGALMEAKTPGEHTFSVGHDWTEHHTDDPDIDHHETLTAKFEADKKGNITVGGQPLQNANLIKISKMLESVPVAKLKEELVAMGFDKDVVEHNDRRGLVNALAVTSDELTHPGGAKDFKLWLGGSQWQVHPAYDKDGQLQGFGIAKIKEESGWQQILSVVLTVLSFIPVTAVFARIASAALAVYNGIKNHSVLGVIAGLASGIVGGLQAVGGATAEAVAGALGTTAEKLGDVAGTVARLATAGQAAMQAFHDKRPGSILGFFAAAAASGADFVADAADGIKTGLYEFADRMRTGATVVNTVDAARHGNWMDAASGAADLADGLGLLDPVRAAFGISKPGATGAPTSSGDESAGLNMTPQIPQGAAPVKDPVDLGELLKPIDPIPNPGPLDPMVDYKPAPDPVTVKKGESLSKIAERVYGDASRWPEIYYYNLKEIGPNPNALVAGAELQMPPDNFRLAAEDRNALFNAADIPKPKKPETKPGDPTDASSQTDNGLQDFTGNNEDRGEWEARQKQAERVMGDQMREEAKEANERAAENWEDLCKQLEKAVKTAEKPEKIAELGEKIEKIRDFAAKHDWRGLAELTEDGTFFAKYAEAMGTPEAKRLANVAGTVATFASAGLTGLVASQDQTNTTKWGQMLNVAVQMMVDVSLGKASPAIGLVDTVLGAAGASQLGVGKNMGTGMQAAIVMMEAFTSDDPGKALAPMAQKLQSGKGGAAMQAAYNFGASHSMEINDAVDAINRALDPTRLVVTNMIDANVRFNRALLNLVTPGKGG